MKLYSIRDRLLNYYMQPFIGPGDNQTLAAISNDINNEERNGPLQKTPSHFEVWTLATIDEETGDVTPAKEFLADCASLIRPSIRSDRAGPTHQAAPAPGRRTGAPRGAQAPTGPDTGPIPNAPPAAPGEATNARQESDGGDPILRTEQPCRYLGDNVD